ncbi:MAG: multidrug effflux MFS transporter [Planctomycetaceae bacterium]|nr:multidrug effflux MFS transporter [Planctomycetaceae bacterium]
MFKLKTNKEYILFLGLLSTVSPLATDMYLPAIPTIAQAWHIGTDTASLSLVFYFVFFAAFMLVFGTMSDKFGRKPILLTGLFIFVAASFLCATSLNIRQLITWRIIQGIGAASPAAISLAICRDIYDGEKRKRALAYIGIILSVVPLTAPTIGSLFLKFADWRFIFITQAMLTSLTLLLSLGYTETLKEKLTANVFHIFGRYKSLILNRGYILANTIMGLISGPFFGFIAFSPIVYIQIFHLNTSMFGLLFALNAGMAMLGAFACTRLIKFFSDNKIITFGISGCIVSALAIVLFGRHNCYLFAAFMSIFTFCCGMTRPLSINLILSQVSSDIGSASGFIVFYTFVVGSTCMALTTAKWNNPILAFGLIAFILPLIVLIMWPVLLKIIRYQND